LNYNPEYRISAAVALSHPFFETEPLPCKPKVIQKFGRDYHDTLIEDLKYREARKEQLINDSLERKFIEE
jgi:hypothetical protein